jgi:hypothetical protein
MTAPAGETQETTASAAESAIVDDAFNATEAIRTTAKWLASALGAIPSLAVVASIVRAPGSAGFDTVQLSAGVVLATVGALIGVLAFAWVLAPVALEDTDVSRISFTRLPGQSFTSWDALANQLATVRRSETAFGLKARSASRASALAEAEAALAVAEVEAAKELADAAPNDAGLKQAVHAARQAHLDAKRKAVKAADTARSRTDDHQGMVVQLDRLLGVRRDAYRLAAADKVGARFRIARWVTILAAALIASGVILLGLAPKETPPEKAPPAAAQSVP